MTASNITWHEGSVTRKERESLLKRRGCTVWLTGLSASGKSTIASCLEHDLLKKGYTAYRLDGDSNLYSVIKDIRFGLNKNLGFSQEDRQENIRRIAEVAKLFADSGCIAITSFISPYAQDRQLAKELHMKAGLSFFEVFVDVPLEVAEQRDPKGLYKKARAGEIKGFTGLDDPYEAPTQPDLHLQTHLLSVEEAVEKIESLLKIKEII